MVNKLLPTELLYQPELVEVEWQKALPALPGTVNLRLCPQDTEQQNSLIIETNDGLWDWNLQTNTVYFSPEWKAMLGYQESEIGDSPIEWLHRIHPDDIEKVRIEITAHLTGRTPQFKNEHRIWHKDETYHWIHSQGRVIEDESGKLYHMVGFQTDITAYRQAIAALRDQMEAELQQVLGHLTLAQQYTTKDKQGEGLQAASRPSLTSVFRFIETNYRHAISLREVAQAVGYSCAYLTNLVQRETGRTVNKWITEYRMAEARLLLLKTNHSVNQIAVKVGYQGTEHFIRQFRQIHGMTPKVWRNEHRS